MTTEKFRKRSDSSRKSHRDQWNGAARTRDDVGRGIVSMAIRYFDRANEWLPLETWCKDLGQRFHTPGTCILSMNINKLWKREIKGFSLRRETNDMIEAKGYEQVGRCTMHNRLVGRLSISGRPSDEPTTSDVTLGRFQIATQEWASISLSFRKRVARNQGREGGWERRGLLSKRNVVLGRRVRIRACAICEGWYVVVFRPLDTDYCIWYPNAVDLFALQYGQWVLHTK